MRYLDLIVIIIAIPVIRPNLSLALPESVAALTLSTITYILCFKTRGSHICRIDGSLLMIEMNIRDGMALYLFLSNHSDCHFFYIYKMIQGLFG
jgi:hypothetical protein